jgi:hypothetical protein
MADPLAGLVRPLKLREYRNRYSSGISREFNCVSVRRTHMRKMCLRILLKQLETSIRENDHQSACIRLRAFRQSLIMYIRAFYRREMPAHLFASTVRRNCTLAVTSEYTGELFRFRSREDLRRVLDALRLPEQCGPFDNRTFIPREACFLYTLRRLVITGTGVSLRQYFGGEKSMWSRAFK